MRSTQRLSQNGRREILRDLYEENLRAVRENYGMSPPQDQASRAGRRRIRTLAFGVTLLCAAMLVFVGITLHAGRDAARRASSSSLNEARLTDLPAVGTAPFAPRRSGERLPSVVDRYGLHFKTIVLDAGHGGRDPGAIGRRGLSEKDVTLDVARRLKRRLEQYAGYRILLTRSTDASMLLRERIEFANRNETDLFVSIHVNWLPVDSIVPVETYYYGPESDARASRLARRENRNSGYSVAEFHEMLSDLRVELKVQESRGAAQAIQEGLVEGLHGLGRDVRDWGAKAGDFMVLVGVEAPSILAEIGSLSNTGEEDRLDTSSYRERLAFLLEQGIVHFLESRAQESIRDTHGSEENPEGV